ncbi:MAG TPA: GH116 family glycosyl hydrolase [Fimbriimonadaceae bacterium]|nr:GH116 family glycosyl hydrolase [Fimbriimonadaceae bacterium]
MLKMAGGAALGLGFSGRILAIFDDGTMLVQDHFVPADKNLSDAWKHILYARGSKEIWSDAALDTIGMPVCGNASGQLYLCGDGTLGCWEIFNHHEFQDYGATSYVKRAIPHRVEFGFEIEAGGKSRKLDKQSYKSVAFKGEFPIGTIGYDDPDFPIQAQMVAYSPFIPLNAKDSGLPATVFEVMLRNKSPQPVECDLSAFLENACSRSGESHPGDRKRHTKAVSERGLTIMTHSADPAQDEFLTERPNPRPAILIADFEGSDYGAWKAEGEAFGPGPAKGTLPDQNPVGGFVGKGLVNTYFKGDGTTGRLTSPDFKIERDFINFKIGGGHIDGKECINLIVDGKIVRTSTGLNSEQLLWDTWNVRDLAGKTAHIEIVDEATDGWGHINIDQIEQADRIQSRSDLNARHSDANLDTGTLSLAVLRAGKADEFESYGLDHAFVGHVRPNRIRLAPGESETVVFVMAWSFPHHPQGHQYTNWFKDSEDTARYVAHNIERLSRDTKLWRDTFYDSTLPYWLLDRLHSTVGNLRTGTTEWWKTGRFWAWEGVVCCAGTCTHVWNYEHSMARLFPELERNIRDRQDFGAGFDAATGLVGFRSNRAYAADGQCGTILKAYREHLTSADDKFLKDHWPRIKKALQYLIGHDGNGDGMIEDAQPNTYDIDFFGANTFVGSLYLAALRAGEAMAKEVDDTAFAQQCAALAASGREATMKRLWNGEYFIQEVDESKYKEYQYGPGCLADQLFGQGWAHQVGLGHIYPRDEVVKGLQSIWKYNWAPDVAAQNKRWPPQRPFAVPGEGGLFTCTWPTGGREKDPVLYRDEVWTGIEYQVAGHMIWEGLVEEGLSICRAVHERYHPAKRNPYNEVECSDHYARAMASWGVFTALSGFDYHGPKGRIAFDPRVTPEEFRSAFTAAEGWGTYDQHGPADQRTCKLSLAWGKLRLTTLTLPMTGASPKAYLGGREVSATFATADGKTTVALAKPVQLKAGETLEIRSA